MTLILAFLFMLIIVAGMAIGVIMGRKPIAGSCGGMKALGLGTRCEVCGGNPQACDSSARRLTAAQAEADSLASDAAAPPRRDVRTL